MTTSLPPYGAASDPRPRLRPEAVRFAFVGYGARAEAAPGGPDRLYLDVGNDLRPGVIDHHHLAAYQGSTAGLVVAHPDWCATSSRPVATRRHRSRSSCTPTRTSIASSQPTW